MRCGLLCAVHHITHVRSDEGPPKLTNCSRLVVSKPKSIMPPKNAELFVGDSRDRDRLVIGEGPAFMQVRCPGLLACFQLTSSIALVLINPDVSPFQSSHGVLVAGWKEREGRSGAWSMC